MFSLVVLAGLALSTPAVAAGGRLGETRAELVGFNAEGLARVDSIIEAALREGTAPGAALAIARRGEMVRLRGYGRLTYANDAPLVSDSTLFDLASLTKVVGTTTAIMTLVDRGRLDLDTPIHQYLAAWPAEGGHGAITLRHLLTHTSGLPAGADLWTTRGRDAKLSRIARMRLVSPPGTQTIYSDLGMIVSGAVIESITGERLDDYLQREVFGPLHMTETLFNPEVAEESPLGRAAPVVVTSYAQNSLFFAPFAVLAQWTEAARMPAPAFAAVRTKKDGRFFDRSMVSPTEFSYARGQALQGDVHDQNAAALDGVAGHAGIFSSARDLAKFAQVMLNASAHGVDAPIFKAETVNLFVARGMNSARALGWETPAGRSSAGDYFAERSFGHTGFTGTSIWIDPERDLFVVLLTNRVYPTAANQKHIALRRAVHDGVELAIEDELIFARAEARVD
jgi:CubicO group peptidase (beta-lactamase class C family)